MKTNQTITMKNYLKGMNFLTKIGLSILLVLLIIYFGLSLKFIFS